MVQILEHRRWKRISTPFEIQAPGTSGGILGLVSQRESIKPSCRRARAGPVIRPEWSFENSSAFRERIPSGTEIFELLHLFYRERQTILGMGSGSV